LDKVKNKSKRSELETISPREEVTPPSVTHISQPSPSLVSRPPNLADLIGSGNQINKNILKYLHMERWTPAMAACLVCGIKAPLGRKNIPAEGQGFDNSKLTSSDPRFYQARYVLAEWADWNEYNVPPQRDVDPIDFLVWCVDEKIDTDWLRLFFDLAGCPAPGFTDLTPSRFALLVSHSTLIVGDAKSKTGQSEVKKGGSKNAVRGARAKTLERYADWQRRADEKWAKNPTRKNPQIANSIEEDLLKEKSPHYAAANTIRQHIERHTKS
jgi:hypothetical protein